MSRKKIAILITSVALLGTLLIGGTLAYFTDQATVENVITLGKVEGELNEPQWKENNPDGEIKNVKPGDKIVKDPILTMDEESEDAYARFLVTYTGLTKEQFAELKFLKITGKDDEGKEVTTPVSFDADGYYYVQEKLTKEDTFKLFDYVVIPTSWDNDMALKTFNINVTVELIQADNFEPVLDASGQITGWGDVTIKEAK